MKRMISLLLVLSLFLSIFPVAFAAEQAAPSEEASAVAPGSGTVYTQAISGKCGDDLTWSFDESTGTLTISGTGYMYDYYEATYITVIRRDPTPWDALKGKIRRLVVNQRSSSDPDLDLMIDDYAFADCTALSEVVFNNCGYIALRAGAFDGCTNLKTVRTPSINDWLKTWLDPELFYFGPLIMSCTPLYYGADLYANGEKVTQLVVPDGTKPIASGKFLNCSSITSVILPSSVTYVGSDAFECPNLSDVTIMNSRCELSSVFGTGQSVILHAAQGSTAEKKVDASDLYIFHACTYVDNGDGTHNFYCTVCNTAKVTNLEHTFDKNGVCDCGYEGACEVVGHNYQKEVAVPVTCTHDGEDLYTCTRCRDSYTEVIPALGHPGITRVAAVKNTCTKNGNILYWSCPTCEKCFTDEAFSIEIPFEDTILAATGHDYEAVVTAPTCTAQGYTTYTCATCKHRYISDYVNLTPHQNVVTEYVAPTCTEPGVISSVCSGCGKQEQMIFPPTGHTYQAVITAPTCTEQGCTTHTCTACGDSYITDEVDALGHSYESVTTEPTCTEAGYTTYTCTACGDSYITDEVAATGHSYEAVVTAPTCTAGGYTTYTCTACGDSYITDEVAATGHSYEAAITEPTCTEAGYTTYTCSACADNYVADEVAATGHDFADGFCSACGEEDPDYLPENPFVDVKEEDYFFTPVLWAVKNEITNGTSENTFSPESSCTRGQIVTFLWRAYGCIEPTSTENPFTDVDSDAYYYKAVLWAVENGITTGISATEFAPDETCTRAQAVTFLYRATGKPTVSANENPFEDVAETDYFYTAVLWAVENSITNGTSATEFAPNDHCSRAQIVTFLYRAHS